MNIDQELGVQSYCFRGVKANQEVIDWVKQCGLSTIELCGIHLDFKDDGKCDEALDLYRKNGVRIVSIGVQQINQDVAAAEKYFAFVKRAGGKVVVVDFALNSVPQSYRTAEKLADQYGLRVAIHNHGGRHWLGSSAMLRHVFANTGKQVGLCMDTAWMLDSGEDPVKLAEEFGERLYGVHIKDFVFDKARKPHDVVIGSGNLDLPKFIAVLKKSGFSGSLILEYEGDINNPVPALKQCVEVFRKTWQTVA